MAISPKTIRMQDEEFWDVVKTVITLLVPIFGVTYESYELVDPFPSKSAVKGTAKSMGSVQKRLCFSANADLADRICWYLACSPDTHVPLKDFVCDVSGQTGPLALDEQGLYLLLWSLSKDSDLHGYVTAMCVAACPLFRQVDSTFWDDRLLSRYDTKKLPVSELQENMHRLFILWRRYIERHYDRRLWGVDREGELRSFGICFEALRNLEKKIDGPPIRPFLQQLGLVDNTLCLALDREGNSGTSLSPDVLQEFLTSHHFSPQAKAPATELLRRYQKCLMGTNRLMKQTAEEKKAPPKTKLVYRYQGKRIEISYDRQKQSLTCRPCSSVSASQWRRDLPVYEAEKIPVGIPEEYLYQLTGGDPAQLHQLADTLARCLSSEKVYPGAIVLPEQSFEQVLVLLEWLTGSHIVTVGHTLYSLTCESAIDSLISQKLDRCPLIFAMDVTVDSNGQKVSLAASGPKTRLTGRQWSRLKKLIGGATISCKDPILGRKKHKNEAQWLICGCEHTLQLLNKHKIPYTFLDIKPLPADFSDARASRWIQFILPLWGMLPKKRRKKQAPKPATPVSTVLQRFLRHCCQENQDKDAFLPARDLYDAYREFSLLQSEQPLLFKDFNRTLEQSYGFKRVRRHTSKNSNKTGFYGIMLLDNMDEIAFTDDTEVDAPYNAEMSRTSFGDTLRAMESMVEAAFRDFPFEALMPERKSDPSVSD